MDEKEKLAYAKGAYAVIKFFLGYKADNFINSQHTQKRIFEWLKMQFAEEIGPIYK